ncbi:MAG: DoxX family membrane protein [Nanoarchaeota archaeon]|nr:DoxX family membrane protein [Nanoarchaeota archaeon]
MTFFNPTILLITRYVLGIILIFSGLIKLPDLKGFFVIVVQYNLVKGKLAKILAYSLPFVEIITGILLISNILLPISSLISLILIMTASLGVIYAYFKNNRLDNCGCYGTKIKIKINKRKITENLILILINLYLFLSTII